MIQSNLCLAKADKAKFDEFDEIREQHFRGKRIQEARAIMLALNKLTAVSTYDMWIVSP